MAKTTYSLYLYPRANANGLQNLVIRKFHNGKASYEKTGIELYYSKKLKESQWDKKNKLIINHRDAKTHNEYFRYKIADLNRQNPRPHPTANTDLSIIDYIRTRIKTLEYRRRFGTAKRYNTILLHLSNFQKENNLQPLQFQSLNIYLLEQFNAYLENTIKPKDEIPSPNTIGNYLNGLKTIINDATDDNVYTGANPFDYYRQVQRKKKLIPSRRRSKPKMLLKPDLWKLFNLEICDATLNKTMFNAVNIFRFCFFSNGIRISDALTLKWKHITDKKIYKITEKDEESLCIEVTPQAFSLLRWYVDYESIDKIWNWKEKKFAWQQETFDDPRNDSKIIALDFDYYDALQEVTRWKDKIERDLPLKTITSLTSYELDMYLRSHIPKGVIQSLKNAEQRRNNEVVAAIKAINRTKKADEYVFPYLRGYEGRVDKRLFNRILSSTTLVNKNLKKVAERLQITPFTTHWQRHSLVKHLAECGIPPSQIMAITGHKSQKNFEAYMNGFQTDTSKAYKQVLKDITF